MMKVNIVLADGDREWICGRFARELVERLPAYGIEARINYSTVASDWRRDLSYHLPVYGAPELRPAVGLFTHGLDRPRRFGNTYSGHLTFSSTLRDALVKYGGARDPKVIDYPVDPALLRVAETEPIIFGVAGRVYGDGRKGEHLVEAAVAAGFTVVAWGEGWPCRIISARLAQLPDFYRYIDYYIDTSSDEGGCVPAAEAMAMGVPVISHTVGVARPVIPYERGNVESMLSVLRALTTPYTYDDFARDHAEVFREVVP